MNHVLQTTFKDMRLYNHFYPVLYGCSLENFSHTCDMEAIPVLSVSQEQMGQPYGNMFSSSELSDSALCCSKHPVKSVGFGPVGDFIWSSFGAVSEQSLCFLSGCKWHKKRNQASFHPLMWSFRDKTHSDCCSGGRPRAQPGLPCRDSPSQLWGLQG